MFSLLIVEIVGMACKERGWKHSSSCYGYVPTHLWPIVSLWSSYAYLNLALSKSFWSFYCELHFKSFSAGGEHVLGGGWLTDKVAAHRLATLLKGDSAANFFWWLFQNFPGKHLQDYLWKATSTVFITC